MYEILKNTIKSNRALWKCGPLETKKSVLLFAYDQANPDH